MALRSFAYDHPAYTVPGVFSGSLLAGASALSQRFLAHANLTIKAVNYATQTIGTGAATDAKTLYIVRQGTATTTIALFTTTAAIYSTSALVAATSGTMAKGDAAYLTKGTDATEVGAVSFEWNVTPGADFTA